MLRRGLRLPSRVKGFDLFYLGSSAKDRRSASKHIEEEGMLTIFLNLIVKSYPPHISRGNRFAFDASRDP